MNVGGDFAAKSEKVRTFTADLLLGLGLRNLRHVGRVLQRKMVEGMIKAHLIVPLDVDESLEVGR